jgi:hypothetical protein
MRTDNLGTQMQKFETAEVIASHEAFENHLTNVQSMARTLAMMITQDSELVATWLRHRKPRKGPRVPLVERVGLARRTRSHGRSAADALLEVISSLNKMAAVHADYVQREKKAPPAPPKPKH